ncbi:lipoyl(octanoyl) transferase LipB [Candidatus Paracaedibacter symbiosus]|uniref:lipoyl(octanoyl) transferase LipB n=1 Tax=Candidatus Paracaedibacter symbiosus TaxID=244582 RepID=UPI000509EEF7|nr:lipoyl(octanoyl) transferase LipB [Candidatus Paracaedibacter symbiosus]
MSLASPHALEWRQTGEPVLYEEALETMQTRVAAIQTNQADELIWLLEHPPLYTAGTSAKESDLIDAADLPVYQTGRGGQFTYHGPGQRVAYVMLDLTKRGKDIRAFVQALEQWVIDTLTLLHIKGERRDGRVGIWVETPFGDEKIAAIGVRVSKWISYHGIAINVAPNLSHFSGIIPCGLSQFGVTSLEKLGINLTLAELDTLLKITWNQNPLLAIR